MFDNKKLRNLIIPLVLEQFLAITIGMADTVMVATCGEAAVSGISLVDQINLLIITILTALATGGAVLASQYIGSGNRKEACDAGNQLFYGTVSIAIVFTIISLFVRNYVLNFVFGDVAADVMASGQTYFMISALSYPFLAAFNAGAALLRAMGDSKTSMYTSMFMNLINVAGNAILIFGFNLGVAGAGIATTFSRIVGGVVVTYLLLNPDRKIFYHQLHKIKFNFVYIKKILSVGIPAGIDSGIFQIGKLLVVSIVATFGTASITANAVCNNIGSIQIIPASAIGIATITVVGQCIGAGKPDEAYKYGKKLLLLAHLSIIPLAIILYIFLDPILAIYNLSAETVAIARDVMLPHLVLAILFWPLSFALPNALRAGGDSKFIMWVSMTTMWTMRIGVCYLLAVVMDFGLVGVWYAMFADWMIRGLCFSIRFKSKKWIKKSLV